MSAPFVDCDALRAWQDLLTALCVVGVYANAWQTIVVFARWLRTVSLTTDPRIHCKLLKLVEATWLEIIMLIACWVKSIWKAFCLYSRIFFSKLYLYRGHVFTEFLLHNDLNTGLNSFESRAMSCYILLEKNFIVQASNTVSLVQAELFLELLTEKLNQQYAVVGDISRNTERALCANAGFLKRGPRTPWGPRAETFAR